MWLEKDHIIVFGPMEPVRGTLLQKTESANRKRLIFWSRNYIYSIRDATVEKQYDPDHSMWKSQNRRESTIFPRSLRSNGKVFDKTVRGKFLDWVQHCSQEVSSKSVTSTFSKCNTTLDSYVQALLIAHIINFRQQFDDVTVDMTLVYYVHITLIKV